MKAVLIKTGEVVRVEHCSTESDTGIFIYREVTKKPDVRYWSETELDFSNPVFKPVDWEQRRFELVKTLSPIVFNCPAESHQRRLEEAIKFADMAVEMLKENNL